MNALQLRSTSPARHNRRNRNRNAAATDPILDDLRSFAKDLGIAGCATMDRDELVESLRQRYLLDSMLRSTVRRMAG
jgi:hypothetical protein